MANLTFTRAFSTLAVAATLVFTSASTAQAEDLPPLTASSQSALFTATKVVPGQVMSACTTLSWNRDAPARLSLQPRVSGPLADMILIRVESVAGGTCATARSQAVMFDGTLSAFAGSGGSSRAMASFEGRGRAAFRFTVQLMDTDAAQGARSSADFIWRVDSDADIDAPVVEPTPGPSVVPPAPQPDPPVIGPDTGSQPGLDPAPGGQEGPPAAGDPDLPVSPGGGPVDTDAGSMAGMADRITPFAEAPFIEEPQAPEGTVRVPLLPDAPAGTTVASEGSEVTGPLMAALKRVGDVSVELGRRAAPPFLILGFVLVFLAVQRRLDAFDPKLSSAMVYAPPKLTFSRSGGQRAANPSATPSLRELFTPWDKS